MFDLNPLSKIKDSIDDFKNFVTETKNSVFKFITDLFKPIADLFKPVTNFFKSITDFFKGGSPTKQTKTNEENPVVPKTATLKPEQTAKKTAPSPTNIKQPYKTVAHEKTTDDPTKITKKPNTGFPSQEEIASKNVIGQGTNVAHETDEKLTPEPIQN
ncbi:MAG: hypothetical protein KAJ86_04935 [Alphaproteobacteria bacterium]|nr:hypothetical protein [Alphaproteobacteria bacterium]